MRWLFGLGRQKKEEQQEEVLEAEVLPAHLADIEDEPEEPLEESEPEPEPEPQTEIAPEIEPEPQPEPEPEPVQKKSWFGRLTAGLARTSSKLGGGIGSIFVGKKLDEETLEELEDLLITADLGVATAAKITANLAKSRLGKDVSEAEIKQALANEIASILRPVAVPFETLELTPQTVVFVGTNGSGKTTTIGKFAKDLTDKGAKVTLAAGDTFRAAYQRSRYARERTLKCQSARSRVVA